MPEISYQAQVQPEALPGRAWPHVPGEVPAGVFGGEIGRGIESVGAAVESVQRHADETQALDAHNQIQRHALTTLNDGQGGGFLSLQGKNAIGAGPQYLQQFDEQAKDVLSRIPSPRARLAAQNSYMQTRNHLEEQINTHTLQQTKEYGLDTAQNTVKVSTEAYGANYNHPDIMAAQRDHGDFALETFARQAGKSPEWLEEAKYQEHRKQDEGALTNMLAENKVGMAKAYFDHVKGELRPQDVKQFQHAIQAGEIDATGNGILAAYHQDTNTGDKQLSQLDKSGLTPEQQSKVIQRVEQGRRELAMLQQANPAIRQLILGLYGSIASGTVAPNALGAVASLYRRGAITMDQQLSLNDQILRAQKKGDQNKDDLSYVRDAIENRTPLDPKDKEMDRKVNLYLAETTMGQPPGSPAYNNAATEITARVGVVPSGAISFSRASLVGGDPKAAAAGAQLMASLERANPRAFAEAVGEDKETRAMADTVNTVVGAGGDPVAAVNLARENAQRSKAERKFLDDAWNAQHSPGQKWLTIDTNAIRSGLSDDPHYRTPGFLGTSIGGEAVPAVPMTMAAEYSDLVKQYFYHTGGDLKQARALALNDLKGTWGVSQVNGKRELMKYAPERMFPNLTVEDIHADKAKEGYGGARLVESSETGSSGGRIWNLAEKDNFGAWDVVRDEQGMPVRYQLPQPKKAQPFEQELKDYEDRQALLLMQEEQKRNEPIPGHVMPGIG
jgi:hypothetical protein